MTVNTSAISAEPSIEPSVAGVWDRLWQNGSSSTKDDEILARERRGLRWQIILDRIETTFGCIGGLRTIELGCGRGDLSALLAERGADVTLLDQSQAALDAARERFLRLGLSARLERSDMFKACRSLTGDYDVVVSLGVVEHFRGDNRTAALAAHHRMLRPGGLAVISVPHAQCLPYRAWKAYLEFRGWWPYGMEIPYSRTELIRRARAAGFERINTHAMGFRQSIADHWCKRITGRRPKWADTPSLLDGLMGFVLLMFGSRKETTS